MATFKDLTVLITGAAGGFGSFLSHRLAEQGARLVLTDICEEKVQQLAVSLPCDTAVLAGDIVEEHTSKDLVALAHQRFRGLDIAINNAGIAQSFVSFHLIPSEEARRVIDVNLMGTFYALKYQLPAMARLYRQDARPRAIVNIASLAGLKGAPRLAAYAAAKHGVIGLTKTAAAEYATRGIRVNAVCPSYARTAMVTSPLSLTLAESGTAEAALTRNVPMSRLAEIEEIAAVILFAASPHNSFMTGQALAADGGATAV